jgi:hypothetical protein
MDFHTSLAGSDLNDGLSPDSAFETVQKGVNALGPGDRLLIAPGTYVEWVRITGLGDEDEDTTAIEILPLDDDGTVVIDGAVNLLGDRTWNLFREAGNEDWVQDGDTDEWISTFPLPQDPSFETRGRAFGAFIDKLDHPGERLEHRRLITHNIPEDLRAYNQKFGPMPEELLPGDPPGFHAVITPRQKHLKHLPRRPWVYLGPGIWQDDDEYVRIRLTPTTHESRWVRNYDGPTDPRQVPLAICTEVKPTLAVVGCYRVEIRGITVRGGGGFAVSVERSKRTVLERVTVLAGPNGVRIHDDSRRTKILHCVVDGGIPPWMFRSDIKDEYLVEETGEHNLLGRQTSNTLLQCAPDTSDLEIGFCEFLHGHDLQVAGTDVELHHSYIADINDDFPFVGTTAVNLHVHHNVVERVLTFMNVTVDASSGPVRVYRNLVDLRRPVLGRRPHPRPSILDGIPLPGDDENDVVVETFDELDLSLPRWGMFFKTDKDEADPELDVFQNTMLVANQTRVAAFPQFFKYNEMTRRRVFNNIFVAFVSNASHDKPIMALPLPHPFSITDGNAYLRLGPATRKRFLHERFDDGPTEYDTLKEMRNDEPYFEASQGVYSPGYERRGIDEPPGFRTLAPWPLDEVVRRPEDLRLRKGALARQHGAILPVELRELDPPDTGPPDIGCYRVGAQPLQVGVGGKRAFPPGAEDVAPSDD